MKITKSQLKQIIKEELNELLGFGSGLGRIGPPGRGSYDDLWVADMKGQFEDAFGRDKEGMKAKLADMIAAAKDNPKLLRLYNMLPAELGIALSTKPPGV